MPVTLHGRSCDDREAVYRVLRVPLLRVPFKDLNGLGFRVFILAVFRVLLRVPFKGSKRFRVYRVFRVSLKRTFKGSIGFIGFRI